ncbi:hypothetical protein HOA91_02675 [Candidatus Woesearchaeota archaeon]|jgi:thymidine kinase|nr:hypothetical protein [Candidatus Woesearchaeota archaeon]
MNFNVLQPGTLHLFVGGMKGSKTVNFLRAFGQLAHTDLTTQLFKPKCDYRESLHEQFGVPRNYIVSRTGIYAPATEVDDKDPEDILRKLDPDTKIVGLGEISLFEKRDRLVEIILGFMGEGKVVIGDGLDKDFRGEPFDPIPTLMAYAVSVEKCYGVCDLNGCNKLGEYSQRLIDGEPAHYDSPQKVVGVNNYELRCLEHHIVPGKPE